MTLPSYPYPELPRPNTEGYGLAPGDGRSKARPDAGPTIRRRRFSSVTQDLTFSIDVELSQKARFWRFYREDTAEGVLPFLMQDWPVHGTPMLKADGTPLLRADGTPILISRTLLCTFGEQVPREAPRGTGIRWRISCSIQVLP